MLTTKEILPNDLRGIGRDYLSLSPQETIIAGNSPIEISKYGLTLKQRGIWNSGFGFHKANKAFISDNFNPLY